MKKSIVLTAVLIVITFCSATAQLKYGAGLVLGTKAGLSSTGGEAMGFGLNGRVYYALSAIDLSVGATYFMPGSATVSGVDVTSNLFQINADAHYAFSKNDNTTIYGLGGLNYSFASAKASSGGNSASTSDSKLGLDLGVGAKMNKFFGEAKYDTALAQLAITVGMNF